MKVLLILAASVVAFCSAQSNNPFDRLADPVVLKGADLPELLGIYPQEIVGFMYDGNRLNQIPIQIDEMHYQLWDNIKDGDCFTRGRNHSALVYADLYTWSGQDITREFDEDDELVFMFKDTGIQCFDCGFGSGLVPPGLLPQPTEVGIYDPLVGRVVSYVYLYRTLEDTVWDQSAGFDYVYYGFKLNNTGPKGTHEYFDAYKPHCSVDDGRYECEDPYPLNPEDSWFSSLFYERHWAQNWFGDEMRIYIADSTGEDMLAIQEFQFFLDDCGRCTESFMDGQTAFIANIDGPVRAIRSWVGANSGCITQREHHMYEQRDDQITYLRVHPIPGAMDYIQYEVGTPLTYYNCYHNTFALGITIDGVDDGPQTNDTFCHWEAVSGPVGTFIRTIDIDHNLFDHPEYDDDVFFEHFYFDNATPDDVNGGSHGSPVYTYKGKEFDLCGQITSKQVEAWGTSGIKMNFNDSTPNLDFIFNTDPLRLRDSYPEIGGLPPGSCRPEVPQPDVYKADFYVRQYYHEPTFDPAAGQAWFDAAAFPLQRF